MRRSRWARSATSGRSRRWPGCSGPRRGNRQPSIAAAICLLGVNCESHESFLIETLKFADTNPGFQELLRSAASGPCARSASAAAPTAVDALFAVGIPSRDPTRAPVALARRRPWRCATRR